MSLTLSGLDGRVELRELVGAGGMGEVHAAWDRGLERAVAVKFVRGASLADADRLLLEARLQARVEHPHVVRVFEVGTLAGKPCIVFQLVRGKSLQELAPELSVADRVELLRQAAAGLHAAHLQGLVHRDVKPGNVLVEEGEDGKRTALVTDFGLAHAEEGGLTRSGVLPGTLDFMAPEQLAGSGPVDFRSDVYALGATLYAVLSGRPPFRIPSAKPDPDEQVRLLRRILDDEAPALRSVAPEVPRELSTIAARAMEKDPGARYPSAEALADDLSRFQRGEPIRATPPTLPDRLLKWSRRNRAASRSLAATLAILLAAGAFALWQSRQAGREALEAARLGALASSLESRMRMEYLSPPHDLRPALAEVRKEVEALRPLAALRGGGPASYALGKGLELLGDLDAARQAYQRAWDLGFRTPQAAEGLGGALARIYQREYGRAGETLSGQVRQDRQKALAAELREPARSYLAMGDAAGWRGPYLRGQIALLEGDLAAARARSAEVLAADPGRYEARTLEAQCWLKEGRALFDDQKVVEAEAALRRADTALEAAVAIARSDPAPHGLLAESHALAARSRVRRSLDAGPDADAAVAWADRAASLDPGSASLVMAQARSLEAKSTVSYWKQGQERLALLGRSVELWRRAVELEPGSFRPWTGLATILYRRAKVLRDAGKDALPDLEEGLGAVGRAFVLAPGEYEVLYLGMLLASEAATNHQEAGQGAGPLLQQAIARGEAILGMEGVNKARTRSVLSDVHLYLAVEDWQSGRDPRPSLERSVALADEAGAGMSGQLQSRYRISHALLGSMALRVGMGDDDRAEVQRCQAILREGRRDHPEDDYFKVTHVELLSHEARRRLNLGLDLADLAAEARALVARPGPETSDPADELEALGSLSLWLATWENARGRDAGPALSRAERWFEAFRRVRPATPLPLAGLASCALERALDLRRRGHPAAGTARRGLALADEAAGRSPRASELQVLRARLLNLAGDGEAARATLAKAYAMQPLVKGSFEARAAETELR